MPCYFKFQKYIFTFGQSSIIFLIFSNLFGSLEFCNYFTYATIFSSYSLKGGSFFRICFIFYNKAEFLSPITYVSSSHHCGSQSMSWINFNKDVLPEFNWLLELQSSISHWFGNDGICLNQGGLRGRWKKVREENC